MEACLYDRIEESTDLQPEKLPKQNKHHTKQGYKCNQNMGVHTTGINSRKTNRLNTNAYFVKKHRTFKCQRYKAMNDLEKLNTIKKNKLCQNCFQGDHFMSKCKSKNRL